MNMALHGQGPSINQPCQSRGRLPSIHLLPTAMHCHEVSKLPCVLCNPSCLSICVYLDTLCTVYIFTYIYKVQRRNSTLLGSWSVSLVRGEGSLVGMICRYRHQHHTVSRGIDPTRHRWMIRWARRGQVCLVSCGHPHPPCRYTHTYLHTCTGTLALALALTHNPSYSSSSYNLASGRLAPHLAYGKTMLIRPAGHLKQM
jgi:hypothetical protein